MLKRKYLWLFILPQLACAFSWKDLWFNQDQQGQQLLKDNKNREAAETFSNNRWKGIAYYKDKQFDKAYSEFQTDKSAQGYYNQGNALAQMQKYQEAIDAYTQSLKRDKNNQDAKDNIELLKKLQQQDKQNNKQDQSQDKNQQEKQDNKQNQSQDNKQSQSDSQQQQGKDQQQNQDNSSQSDKNGNSQQNQAQNNQQNKNQEQNKSGNNNQQNNMNQQNGQQSSSQQNNKQNDNKAANANEADKQQSQNQQQSAQKQSGNQQKNPQPDPANEITQQPPPKNQEKPAANAASSQYMTPEQKQQQELKAELSQIPDDPGGLLRNKFIRDYQKEQQEGNNE